MSRRRDLLQHLNQLDEIREIMNAMKNLALMETRKLSRYLDTQQQVVGAIEEVAADLVSFHPDILPQSDDAVRALLLIGTERGFCGDFNKALIDAAVTENADDQSPTDRDHLLLAVGHKLCARLADDPSLALTLAGPNVAEEVPEVLSQLIRQLGALQIRYPALSLTVLYHDALARQVVRKILLPPFQALLQRQPQYPHAPVVNLAPAVLLSELIDHYLFAALHEIFYTSLAAENRRRVEHMEGAVARLDDQASGLKRRANVLRQEEITEEIEVILLSAESLAEAPKSKRDR